MISKTWDLEVLIDQFTWIPWVEETAIIPEMRWLNFLTVFPESIDLGELVVRPMRTHGPMKKNYMVAEKEILAQDYLSATQIIFRKAQQMLDLLSVVTSRGFRICRVGPSAHVLRKLGLTRRPSFQERLRSYLLRRLSTEQAVEGTIKGSESAKSLSAYKEFVAVSKAEGFLEEDIVFTTDFPGKQALTIEVGMLREDEFNRRLVQARKNLSRIMAEEKLNSAIRLYRVSLQLDDYIVRYVLLWTALESATQVPYRVTGKEKIDWISSRIINVPGVMKSENAKKILQRLNLIRNTIVHRPAAAIRQDFQEGLTKSLVELEWLLYNHILSSLALPMLPEVSNPFKN